ncbi:MAG TPA: carbonic anhydrase [Gemmataceae bacterium]
MHKILEGYRRFKANVFEARPEYFERLARKQQRPQALFITCSDSRIDPCLLTQTEPGDLFILRNAGNIVPPYSTTAGASTAAIEYAVSVLKVPSVILCGHSHCGAMGALLDPDAVRDLPAVSAWVAHAECTRRIMQTKHAAAPAEHRPILAVYENVLAQLANLRTHPSVAAGLAQGTLHLYGWVYFIETGEIEAYDAAAGRFVSLSETYPSPLPVETRLETDGEVLAPHGRDGEVS